MGCTPSKTRITVQPPIIQSGQNNPPYQHTRVTSSKCHKDFQSSKQTSENESMLDHNRDYELIPGIVNTNDVSASRDMERSAPRYTRRSCGDGSRFTEVQVGKNNACVVRPFTSTSLKDVQRVDAPPASDKTSHGNMRLLSGTSSQTKYRAQGMKTHESSNIYPQTSPSDTRESGDDENGNRYGLRDLPLLSAANKMTLWREKSVSHFWYNVIIKPENKETSPLSRDSQYYSQPTSGPSDGRPDSDVRSWTDISEDGSSASINSLSTDDTLPAAYKQYRDRSALMVTRPKAAVGRRSVTTQNRRFHVESLRS